MGMFTICGQVAVASPGPVPVVLHTPSVQRGMEPLLELQRAVYSERTKLMRSPSEGKRPVALSRPPARLVVRTPKMASRTASQRLGTPSQSPSVHVKPAGHCAFVVQVTEQPAG